MQSVTGRIEISLERVVDCPFGVVQEYTEDYLSALRPAGEVQFAARPDLTDSGKPHDEIAIRWCSGSHLFGEVELIIRFRISRLSTRLLLSASCRRSDGTDDPAIDRSIAEALLRAALTDLLERIGDYAEQRERRYRREQPPALGPVRPIAMLA